MSEARCECQGKATSGSECDRSYGPPVFLTRCEAVLCLYCVKQIMEKREMCCACGTEDLTGHYRPLVVQAVTHE